MTPSQPPPAEPDTVDPAADPAPADSSPRRTGRGGGGPRRGRDLKAAGVMILALSVLGLPLGVLWHVLTPRVEMVRVTGGWSFTEENPEQYMAADGVFALLGFGAGVLVALTVWFGWRSRRGPLLLTGLVLGSIGCQIAAWQLGRYGRQDYVDSLESVRVGWHTWRAPELLMVDFHPFGSGEPGRVDTAWEAVLAGDYGGAFDHLSLGVLATMAFAVAFTYTVCAGWSKYASLRAERLPGDDVL